MLIVSVLLSVKGEGEFGAAGLAGENGVAAVVRHSSLSVQTHSAEELLQAALGIHCRREAARFGSGVGGTTETLQSLLLVGAGDGTVRRRRGDGPHTGENVGSVEAGEAFQVDVGMCDKVAVY